MRVMLIEIFNVSYKQTTAVCVIHLAFMFINVESILIRRFDLIFVNLKYDLVSTKKCITII